MCVHACVWVLVCTCVYAVCVCVQCRVSGRAVCAFLKARGAQSSMDLGPISTWPLTNDTNTSLSLSLLTQKMGVTAVPASKDNLVIRSNSFIRSDRTYALSTHYVPGSVLGAGGTAVNKENPAWQVRRCSRGVMGRQRRHGVGRCLHGAQSPEWCGRGVGSMGRLCCTWEGAVGLTRRSCFGKVR